MAGPLKVKPDGTWNEGQIFAQMMAGERWGIFVDDTGTHTDRPAGVAVVVPPETAPGALCMLGEKCQQLEADIGTHVHHFRELVRGNPPFDCYTEAQRHSIMSEFTFLFDHYGLPVVVFQDGPEHDEMREKIREVMRKAFPLPWANYLMKPSAFVMLGVLIGTLSMKDHFHPGDERPVSVFWDTVGKTTNRDMAIGNAVDGVTKFTELDPPGICIRQPAECPPLELADFAAWSYHRLADLHARLPLGRREDLEMLRVLRPMADHFAGVSLPHFETAPLAPTEPG